MYLRVVADQRVPRLVPCRVAVRLLVGVLALGARWTHENTVASLIQMTHSDSRAPIAGRLQCCLIDHVLDVSAGES